MNKKALRALKRSGWSPDRRVSIQYWIDELTSEGFTIHPEAVTVLQNYGSLRIETHVGTLTFDPLFASGEFDMVQYWETRLAKKLSPIGEAEAAMILLADDGLVFGSRDGELIQIGTSFQDAIDGYFFSKWHEVPHWFRTEY
jgi:hypothetical protein